MWNREFFLVMLITAGAICGSSATGNAPGAEVDPRGPLQVVGIKPQIVVGGVEAVNYQPAPELKEHPVWNASWIWLAPQEDARKTPAACFRKNLNFAEAPRRVTAWISADWHYRLYVNGHLAARGPADPGEDYPSKKNGGKSGIYFADYCDLTPWFRKGENLIAFEVFRERLGGWWGSSGASGLFFQARAALSDHSIVSIESDETWRSRAGDYLQSGSSLQYFADKEPAGWRLANFSESDWMRCVKIEDHWPKLLPSELPQPLEINYPDTRVINASSGLQIPRNVFRNGQGVVFGTNGEFTLQFDRVLSAYAGLKIKGAAGATVTLDFGELTNRMRRATSLHIRQGVQYFETPCYTSFAFLRVRVSGVTSPVELEDVRAIFSAQPVSYRGTFSCSDPALNQIWLASRWATHICMQDRYLDSPDHQEPICDPGDYLIESLVNYYAFQAPTLTRQDLRKFAALLANNHYVNFHTSYSLLWLQMLMDYYDYTGDAATVRELAPQVRGLMEKFTGWCGRNGLISEAPDYMFMDWVNIGGFGAHHPPAVIGQGYLTAFYYRGLLDAKRVAELTGDLAAAARYDQLRAGVSESYNRELWSEEKGLYRDGKPFQTSIKPGEWLPADEDIETFSAQNNALAVLYDLAPVEKQRGIMTRLMAGDLNCQPYFMHFVLNALAHAGLFDEFGAAQMRRWKIVPETRSFHEMWDGGDLSHGWGGTPLYQMGSKILGVTPLAPGFERVRIAPTICDLKWAKGTVPTPRGDVVASWSVSAQGMKLDVNVPAGVQAEVNLPVERFSDAIVYLDGHKLSTNDVFDLASGNHRFVLKGTLVAPSSR